MRLTKFLMTGMMLMVLIVGGFSPVLAATAFQTSGPNLAVVESMKTKLSLTPDQATKIKDILTKSYEQSEKDRASTAGNKEAFKKLNKTRKKQTKEQIKSVLTQDQVAKFDQVKSDLKAALKPKKA